MADELILEGDERIDEFFRVVAEGVKNGTIFFDPSGSAPHDMSLADPNLRQLLEGERVSFFDTQQNRVEIPKLAEDEDSENGL